MKNPPGRKIVLTVLLAALGACESSTLPVDAGEVAEIRIAPQPARVELESSMRLNAQVLDAGGNPVGGHALFWSSENTAIARVSGDGEVTGVATGTTRVAASAEGLSGVTTVNVVPRAVMKVTVSPPSTNLLIGEAATLTAAVLDRTDKPLEGRALTWTSTDSLIAAVASNGRVTARREGTAVIRATSEGVTGEATVVVSRVPVATVDVTPATATLTVGESQKLTATPRATNGTALEGRVVSWTSSNPGVVSMAGDGTASAVGVGVAVVTALVEGRTGTANLTVSVRQVANVEISPTSAQIFVAATQQFTATPKAADGSTLTGRTISRAATRAWHAWTRRDWSRALRPGRRPSTPPSRGRSPRPW
jgi:trimeric autotransporter adhesin